VSPSKKRLRTSQVQCEIIKISTYHRNIIVVKVVCDSPNIFLVIVVPPALMVGQTEVWWKRSISGQESVLAWHILGLGSEEDKDVHDTGFRNPVGLDLRLGLTRSDKVRDWAQDSGWVFLHINPNRQKKIVSVSFSFELEVNKYKYSKTWT